MGFDNLPTLLHIEYKGQVVGQIFLDLIEQKHKIGRVDVIDHTSIKELALILCMNLPLYQDYRMSSQICEFEHLWGWGTPFRQMIHCAIQFVKEWKTMNPQQFRNRVIKEFIKWGAEVDISNIDRYGIMIDAMVQVIYEINKDIHYIIKT